MNTYQCSNGHQFHAVHAPGSCPVGTCSSRLISLVGEGGHRMAAARPGVWAPAVAPLGAPLAGQAASHRSFLISFWIGLGGYLISMLFFTLSKESFFLVGAGLFSIALLVALIFSLTAVHRGWRAVQALREEYAAMKNLPTAGQAVGFLFIPLFQLYWLFIGIAKLPAALNLYAESRNLSFRRMNSGIGIAFCVLELISVYLLVPLALTAEMWRGSVDGGAIAVVAVGLSLAEYGLWYLFVEQLYRALLEIEQQA